MCSIMLPYTREEAMSQSIKDDKMNDVANIAKKNPKVDAEKLAEAIKLARTLRAHGVSGPGYNLVPPFRRQMHVKSGYGTVES